MPGPGYPAPRQEAPGRGFYPGQQREVGHCQSLNSLRRRWRHQSRLAQIGPD